MTNLTTVSGTNLQNSTNNSEVTVNTHTGEAYISQRKAAELLGVGQSTLSSYIERHLRSENLDISQGLTSEIFANALFYFTTSSRKRSDKAIVLLEYLNSIKDWTLQDVFSFEYISNSKRDTSGFIYLLECNEYHKIGVSKTSVEQRVKALETGNPYDINIVFYKKVKNCYRAERNLHLRYKDFYHKNEWFVGLDIEEVIAFMSNIR